MSGMANHHMGKKKHTHTDIHLDKSIRIFVDLFSPFNLWGLGRRWKWLTDTTWFHVQTGTGSSRIFELLLVLSAHKRLFPRISTTKRKWFKKPIIFCLDCRTPDPQFSAHPSAHSHSRPAMSRYFLDDQSSLFILLYIIIYFAIIIVI